MRIGWFAAGVLGVALAVPAVAQDRVGSGLVGSNQVTVHRGGGGFDHSGRFGRFDRRGGFGGGSVWIDRGGFQGDTAWRSDSFNDWWHDRPDRSLPRWLSNNQDCRRLWWSGGGWRC